MHDRRAAAALFIGHRRAAAVLILAHMLPEFFKGMGDRGVGQSDFDLIRQRVIRGVHVGEFGAAKRLAVTPRNPDAIQHVHETNDVAIRHVGVPVLPGIGERRCICRFL